MKKLTLVVDERELSTIRAALLLLQEQVDMLPEDVADLMCEHGMPVTGAEIDQLSRCLGGWQDPANTPPRENFSASRLNRA